MTCTILHETTTVPESCTCDGQCGTVSHEWLVEEQRRTLETPRRKPTVAAWILLKTMDLLYGRRRTMEKFLVLELVALFGAADELGVQDLQRHVVALVEVTRAVDDAEPADSDHPLDSIAAGEHGARRQSCDLVLHTANRWRSVAN